MPELPEVESVRRALEKKAVGRRIVKVDLRLPKLARGVETSEFCRRLKGQHIRAVGRRGKYLLMELDDLVLAGHLGMTGQLTFWKKGGKESPVFLKHPVTGLQKTPSQHPPDKHTHLLFLLDHGDRLQYRDIRQFGHWRLLEKGGLAGHPALAKLGVEPLGPRYIWKTFLKAFRARRGKIKALLLSQSPVAGLGNIYADEALFLAGIRPGRRAETLKEKEWKALFKAIPSVLQAALRRGGTTFSDFRGLDGRPGGGKPGLKVYGRAGQKCLRCGAELKKMLVSQRTTVYCARCQR